MKKTGTVKEETYYKKGFTGKSVKKNDTNSLSVCQIKGPCPIPDVYRCQFHYGGYDAINMSSSANLYTGQYIYAANSLYDPLQSGGGTQPYYYDQLVAPASGISGLFKAWKVSGCKIELEFCAAASNTVPVYVWLCPSHQTTPLSLSSLQISMSTQDPNESPSLQEEGHRLRKRS